MQSNAHTSEFSVTRFLFARILYGKYGKTLENTCLDIIRFFLELFENFISMYLATLWENVDKFSCYCPTYSSYAPKVRFLEGFLNLFYTRTVSQLVTSLPTICQQVLFAMLVPRCQQVCNKLLAIGKNLIDNKRSRSPTAIFISATFC